MVRDTYHYRRSTLVYLTIKYHSFHFLWCCMFCYVIVGNPQVDTQPVIWANENSRGFEVPNEKKCLYKASNFAFLFSLLFSSFWYSFGL
ncbi:hypothetical protein BDB00DRAFT_859549 [Zychaea mexicana]|uniref:uncharacterized protein n=1 Tax=Zychaea mexicana TaxID=64656 RepID=UPI0022FE7C98|nr:uncharacterized protein BDB00DRAFT_859549 [Zychaea mexicana]KAI9477088.1 hypothetical protein BDB00DRAFT_859549 [Zychaea mexicana]